MGPDVARVKLAALAIDAVAPAELARFWARALRWEVGEMSSRSVVDLVPTDQTSFRLQFRSGATAKSGQNPIHFDLTSTSPGDQGASVADLLASGARPADVGQVGDEGHVVLADPEGNEFCVIEPGNRFLASCPRLGAVNCDGTKELGRFYSAVLGWPLVWDQHEETAIQSPDRNGPKITWSGPPLMPRSDRPRIHFHLAPRAGTSAEEAVVQLVRHGATRADGDGRGCTSTVALTDVDGNLVCLVDPSSTSRQRPRFSDADAGAAVG